MKLLEFYSIPFKAGADNAETTCFHCGSDNLSISLTGNYVYQCWKCKEEGNAYTFIRSYYDSIPSLSLMQTMSLCKRKQGIHNTIIKQLGIKYAAGNYLIPVYGHKGNMLSLHKYNMDSNIVFSPPKPTTCTVLGMNQMAGTEDLFVCEGHWDYMALLSALRHTPKHADVIASCGSSFASNYMSLLEDKNVFLLFDNDEAGRNGVMHLARRIKSSGIQVKSLLSLNWNAVTVPSLPDIPDKFDIRDMIIALGQ